VIGAVIFDLDGLLVDSERLWCQAEMRCFGAVGIELDEELCRQTVGMRVDEVVQYWYARQPELFPSAVPPSPLDMADRVMSDVATLLRAVPTKPGAEAAVRFCADRGVRLAIASSSPYSLINAALTGTGLAGLFGVIHSADDEDYGKPHPAVYLSAAAKLGVAPTDCLAIEDSLAGVIAAKAARMRCVAVPEWIPAAPGFAVADQVLTSLTSFGPAGWAALGGE
jgi:mannitol-1-/sugar-/sorbitol-6-/2-deoxyglucose-6-phosphatase